jgi:2-(1,2-epoxy-1,2-dihydrophenyl)acetyl-CoA isomerase
MSDLLETTEDGIAWLTLNRPDRLNAFSPAMLLALGEALQRLGSDAEVGAIVITGAGRGFFRRRRRQDDGEPCHPGI